MTNISQKVSRASQWTESTWSEIADHVAVSFRLESDERDQFASSSIAKLVGAIPFLARCEHPMRTAVSNLAVYMMSVGSAKSAFNPTVIDDRDVLSRLQLARYEGGEQGVIDRGMALIALNMIADYKRDVIVDIINGKHNPIATGAWDYHQEERKLLSTVESVECPQMDEIVTVPEIINGTWAWRSWPSWF